MTAKLFKNKMLMLIIFVDLMLVLATFTLMSYVQFLMNEDVRTSLTEIVTQNKDIVTSKLLVEMDNIATDARQIAERFGEKEALSSAQKNQQFLEYSDSKGDITLIWADKMGTGISGKGAAVNIASRAYFRLGMQGIANISERLTSRINGEDIFVICSPVILNGTIIGTIQKQYTQQQMYNLCSVSLFAEKGQTYIVNGQGYILINSGSIQNNSKLDNIYKILGPTDSEASEQLKRDIKIGKSGLMLTHAYDKDMFSAYTPIEQVPDWYLISSIETSAASPNSRMVSMLFYGILIAVLLLFTFSMLYYMRQKKKQQAGLEQVAFVDTVTQGDTYTKFMLDMQYILKSNPNKTFSICSFDVDSFKYINMFYGFNMGDQMLSDMYWSIRKKLSSCERIARVNSDHFVMLLQDASMESINQIIGAEYNYQDITAYLSTGVYTITNPSENINLMLDKSNMAANLIKGLRYETVAFYSDEMDAQLTRNEQIKRAIGAALKNSEIIPYFQPKVDIYTRKIVGAEVLCRWIDKDGKIVLPGDFLPVCERTGIITLVDMAIFEQTLKFIRMNMDKGIQCMPISVNFSRLHLFNDNFLQNVLEKMDEYSVPHELIEIELTESVFFDNSTIIEKFIHDLHECKLKISMDDFGSGFSSLNLLKDLDVDVLKIDRGFILQTENSQRQRVVLNSIVEMAQKLNISVVVEGVETEESLQMVKEFGVSIVQGYYFAKPMCEADFAKICRTGII